MVAVLDIAVAALAMVLVVSGVLKIRDPDATVPMLEAIRLPASRTAVLGLAAVEIVLGATALVVGGPLPTAALALAYAGFAGVGLVLLRGGAAVPCGCFGQRSAPMTPVHVGVDAVAALVGVTALVLGAGGLFSPSTDLEPGVLAVALVAAALLAATVVALLTVVPSRLTARPTASPLRLAIEPFDPTTPATSAGSSPARARLGAGLVPLTGTTPGGEPISVAVAGTGRLTLLAFLTSGCTTCLRFWDAFALPGGAALPGDRTDLVVVTHGADREDLAAVARLAPSAGGPVVVCSSEAWRDYDVAAGPYLVLVDGERDRILGDGTGTSWPDAVALVRQAVRAVGMAE